MRRCEITLCTVRSPALGTAMCAREALSIGTMLDAHVTSVLRQVSELLIVWRACRAGHALLFLRRRFTAGLRCSMMKQQTDMPQLQNRPARESALLADCATEF